MKLRILPVTAAVLALGLSGVLSAQIAPAVQQGDPAPTVAPEPTVAPTAVTEYPGAELVEVGGLRFLLPGEVANDVTAAQVEAVPMDPDTLFSESFPAHTQISFVDYLPDSAPELTHNFTVEPRISVFSTLDFPEFASESGIGWPGQLGLLRGILDGTIRRSPETASPYLPLVNAAQVFRSREQVVRFNGGWGLVYLTSFAQDVSPIVEGAVQLTFQGITDDGNTYISAAFPLDTSYFPDEIGEDFDFAEFSAGYEAYLTETREAIDALPADAFAPDLGALLALVGSIEVI
jgi:hypothetical protein